MTRLLGIVALLTAILALLGPLSAGDNVKKGKDVDAIFQKLDTNKDGRLSRDEFLKIAERFRDKDKARTQLGQAFDKLDPDRKGLTRDQFRTYIEASGKKKTDQARNKGEK